MQNASDLHSIVSVAAKLRVRIVRRKKLGYHDVSITFLDLERLIKAALSVCL